MTEPTARPQAASGGGWWNRTVIGAGITSFLADLSYETLLAVLPHFLAIIQVPVAFLGMMEGAADAISSFVKLGAGWWSDRIGRRKPLVVAGYAVSAVMSILTAAAVSWPAILIGRLLAWLGKGVRGPLRNALLAEAVTPANRAKTFAMHRVGDTLGAIIGPILAALFINQFPSSMFEDPTYNYRILFLLTAIPAILSALAFALAVPEKKRLDPPKHKLWAVLGLLPMPLKRWLIGVGVFGIGDFSHTLLIVAAGQLLTPSQGAQQAAVLATVLYAVRNVAHVLAAIAVGSLSERVGRNRMLVAGYALGVATMLGFVLAFVIGANLAAVAILFVMAGAYLAVEETLEPTLTADMVPDENLRGTAFGLLGVVNGVGDFIASAVVGLIWWFNPAFGFAFAAAAMAIGAVLTSLCPRGSVR